MVRSASQARSEALSALIHVPEPDPCAVPDGRVACQSFMSRPSPQGTTIAPLESRTAIASINCVEIPAPT
jgi:hypothetical protein